MRYLIDPPGPYAPTKDWLAFQAEMKRLDQSEPAVQAALEMARRELDRRRSSSSSSPERD